MHAPYQKLTPILSDEIQGWEMKESSRRTSPEPSSKITGVQVRAFNVLIDEKPNFRADMRVLHGCWAAHLDLHRQR
jgi:hypothetical protein